METMPALFDYIIINNELEKAYIEFINSISDELKDYRSNYRNDSNNNS